MNSVIEVMSSMMREIVKMPAQVAAYVALGAVIIGTALSFGMLPQIFGGFARADRVNRIASELNTHVAQIAKDDNSHWANQTATALLRMDQARCALPPGRLRRMYDELIQTRQEEFDHLTGRYFPLPRCGDL